MHPFIAITLWVFICGVIYYVNKRMLHYEKILAELKGRREMLTLLAPYLPEEVLCMASEAEIERIDRLLVKEFGEKAAKED